MSSGFRLMHLRYVKCKVLKFKQQQGGWHIPGIDDIEKKMDYQCCSIINGNWCSFSPAVWKQSFIPASLPSQVLSGPAALCVWATRPEDAMCRTIGASGNDICQKMPKRTKPPWQHQTEPKQKESLISLTQFWQILTLTHMGTSWGLKDSLCWNRIGNGIQCKFLLHPTPTANS